MASAQHLSGRGTAKNRLSLALICLLAICLLAYHFSVKSDFHNDEYTSFTIANNADGGMITHFESNKLFEDVDKPYLRGMAARRGHRFDFAQTMKNDSEDTLPPLYYMLIHASFSLFAGSFSIWYAAAVNAVLFVLCILALYRLSKELGFGQKASLAICALFAVLPGILEIGIFIRMYILAMLFAICLCVGCVRLVEGKLTKGTIAWVFGALLGGALTHYYFLVLAFFQCLVTGIILLKHKQWRGVAVLAGVSVVAAILAVVIFPPMISQLFSGRLNNEGVDNLLMNSILDGIVAYMAIIDTRLFGGLLLFFVAMSAFLFKGTIRHNKDIGKWAVLILPGLAYFLFISKSAFVLDTRYMSLIYPILTCSLVRIAVALDHLLLPGRARNSILALVCALTVSLAYGSYTIGTWEYGGRQTKQIMSTLDASYRSAPVLVLHDAAYRAEDTWMVNKGSAGVAFTTMSELNGAAPILQNGSDTIIVEIDASLDQRQCLSELSKLFPQTPSNELLGDIPYFKVYALKNTK